MGISTIATPDTANTFIVWNKPTSGGLSYQRMFSSGPTSGDDYTVNGVYAICPTGSNGVSAGGPGIVSNAWSGASKALQNFFFGCSNKQGLFFVGDVGEFILTPNLTTEEFQIYEGYIHWKWGLQALLDTSHPYYSAAPTLSVYLRSVCDQPYDLSFVQVRAVLDQTYNLTDRQISTLIQVYGLKMLATLTQPYGDMPKRRSLLDQMYGDCLPVRRLLDQMYGDMPQYRAELDQQWVMLQDLRAELVQSYHIAADQVRAIFDAVYGLPEHDRVVALLDQLYVLAAGEAIVQQTAVSVVVTTDGVERIITSAYNINIEQDDSIYHMTGELQLANQGDYLFCRAIGPGVAPSTVTVTIDGESYDYIVERKQKARTTEGIAYAVVLASKTLLLGHKHAAESSVDEAMLSGMAQTIVEDLAAGVCTVDWRLVDWYIPANRLYVNGRRRIEVIRQIVEAVGGILQSFPNGTLICRPEYPVDVDKWQHATPDIELADQDNFFSIMPSADQRDGFNRFFVADQQLGESGERIDDEQVSTYERHVMIWYVPWEDISGMRLHHSGGSWISVVENGIASETIEEQIEIVDGQGRVSKPCYGDLTVAWLQQDLGAVTIEEDGTVTTEIAGNSLALISYSTRYFSFNVRGDRVEDVQVYPEVIA